MITVLCSRPSSCVLGGVFALAVLLAIHGPGGDAWAQEAVPLPATDGPAPEPVKWDGFRVRNVCGLQIGHGQHRIRRETQGNTLTDEQSALVDEMGKVGSQVVQLAERGDYPQAIGCLETTLAIMFELFGDDSHTSYSLLPTLAGYYESQGDLPRASAVLQHLLEHGMDDQLPQEVDDVRAAHRRLTKVMQFTPAQRQVFDQYLASGRQVRTDQHAGRYHRAATGAARSRVLAAELFGEDSLEYALALNNLAALYHDLETLEEGLSIQLAALVRLRSFYNERHPCVITAVSNVASIYKKSGNLPLAATWQEEAVELSHDQQTGRDHIERISVLAAIYSRMGRREEAKELLRRASGQLVDDQQRGMDVAADQVSLYGAIAALKSAQGDHLGEITADRLCVQAVEQVYGRDNTLCAIALSNLGVAWYAVGDIERARDLFAEARDISRQSVGEDHPTFAACEMNLGTTLQAAGDFAQAEQLLLHALAVYRKALGEMHMKVAYCYHNLAKLHIESKQTEAAGEYLQQAAKIAVAAGESSLADLGRIRYHQAFLYHRLGRLTEAAAFVQEAYALHVRSCGEQHPDINTIRLTMARILEAQGERQAALTMSRQSLSHMDTFITATLSGLSERQRLQLIGEHRRLLDYYLHLTATLSSDVSTVSDVYALSLKWKGLVAEQAQADRLISQSVELVDDEQKLRRLRAQYASLAFAIPPAGQREAWSVQLQQLRTEKEDLEADLSQRSATFRQAQREVVVDELVAALPDDTVFLDFFQYGEAQPQLAAFVVRRGQPVERVELGAADLIAQNIETWRAALHQSDSTQLGLVAAELCRQIIRPLQPYLATSGTLLVSPDGALHRIPFAALPTADGDRYLVESYAIGYMLSARQLLDTAGKWPTTTPGNDTRPGLAAVGDVAYGSAGTPPHAPADDPQAWTPQLAAVRSGFAPLPGTAVELESIAKLFQTTHPDMDAVLLRGQDADEARVKAALARKPQYVHLATHGFFAPPTVVSAMRTSTEIPALKDAQTAIRGLSPWLLSGLVLSSAAADGGLPSDGILTAEEVNGLDLHGTRLVVLSACDTGLGDVAGGEGVLGLQRAFQVAGARRVLTSLWRVDDAATAALMDQFYTGIWQQGMSEIEALRQAQLALLQDPSVLAAGRRQLAARFPARGLVLEGPSSATAAPDMLRDRTHPRLWAAFVLNGSLLDNRPR